MSINYHHIILNRKTVPKERCNILGPKKCMGDIGVDGRLAWMFMGMSARCAIKAQSMLAVDAFCGYLSDRIRNRLRNKNIDLVIIPNGMTSQLQPLDVSLNKPFKHLFREQYDACLNNDNHILTPSGK
jgi:hypothetical protein